MFVLFLVISKFCAFEYHNKNKQNWISGSKRNYNNWDCVYNTSTNTAIKTSLQDGTDWKHNIYNITLRLIEHTYKQIDTERGFCAMKYEPCY